MDITNIHNNSSQNWDPKSSAFGPRSSAIHLKMWKQSFCARFPSNSHSWWRESEAFVRDVLQIPTVEDVKTKLLCQMSFKFQQLSTVDDVKTTLLCEMSFQFQQVKMWKRGFCARRPSNSNSRRCENEAFVQINDPAISTKFPGLLLDYWNNHLQHSISRHIWTDAKTISNYILKPPNNLPKISGNISNKYCIPKSVATVFLRPDFNPVNSANSFFIESLGRAVELHGSAQPHIQRVQCQWEKHGKGMIFRWNLVIMGVSQSILRNSIARILIRQYCSPLWNAPLGWKKTAQESRNHYSDRLGGRGFVSPNEHQQNSFFSLFSLASLSLGETLPIRALYFLPEDPQNL